MLSCGVAVHASSTPKDTPQLVDCLEGITGSEGRW
jgi:hypothetical protein